MMKINSKEISSLIKEQIKHYNRNVDSSDVGTVISVGDGIALVYGLTQAMLGELLIFPNDVSGLVMNLEADHVGVVLLGDDIHAKEMIRNEQDMNTLLFITSSVFIY